jgi:hypothetical protein
MTEEEESKASFTLRDMTAEWDEDAQQWGLYRHGKLLAQRGSKRALITVSQRY